MVASRNPDKVAEVEEILSLAGSGIEIVQGLSWPEVAETADTLEGNALLKARAVSGITGLAALSDDTGLEVDALGGAPGVRTARFAGPRATYAQNVAKLLARLEGISPRTARFRTVAAVATPQGLELIAEGVVEGSIATERRGSGGFGYDPIFEVDGETLAEMSAERKHAISHRARALRALLEQLR